MRIQTTAAHGQADFPGVDRYIRLYLVLLCCLLALGACGKSTVGGGGAGQTKPTGGAGSSADADSGSDIAGGTDTAATDNGATDTAATDATAIADTASADVAGDDTSTADTTSISSPDASSPDASSPDASSPDASATCPPTWQVVKLKTSDGLTLEADYRPATTPGRGAVVLLHMIPPSWNRKSWPLRVRNLLAAGDVAVLSVDRRGAGKSQGVAKDAYVGPGGAKDVAAAVNFLVSSKRPCPSSPSHVMLIGASNGTTSVLDYTLGHAKSAPHPAGVAWLSPGSYTEKQYKISAHRAVLDKLPLLFVHPSSEPWSKQWMDKAAKGWGFLEVNPGKHGTKLFDDGPMEKKVLGALLPRVKAAVSL